MAEGTRTFEGSFTGASEARVAIVAARFNHFVVDRLVDGARDALRRHGLPDGQVRLVRVPGAWEIPLAVKWLCDAGDVDVVIALGAVIRGATPHFDYVAGEAARGCATAMMDSGVPVVFGVLTTDTVEQAIERAGTKAGNKGWDAALAALEMVGLERALSDAGD